MTSAIYAGMAEWICASFVNWIMSDHDRLPALIVEVTCLIEELAVKPMRIWLDDVRDPTDIFIQKSFLARGDEVWIKTAEEVIKLIDTGSVEFISFDHDLGEGKTGYDVAKHVEEQAYFRKIPQFQWRIHSANSVGRVQILTAMTNADKYWNSSNNVGE